MTTAATIVTKLTLDNSQFQSGLTQAGKSVDSFQAKMKNIGQSMASAGKMMTVGLTLPIVAGMTMAVKGAMDLDVEMKNIQSISRQTNVETEALRQGFIKMSTDLGKTTDSATNLANAFYFIQSAGYAAGDAQTILEVSTKAASAGLTTTNVAAKAILATLSAYGLKAGDAAHVSDVLFKTVDLGVLTFDELATQLGDVVSTASISGVSIEEVGAALVQMTRGGISSSESVTALNQLMLQFISPSKKMADAAKAAGVDLSLAALRSKGLRGALADIEKIGGDDIMLELFGDNVRALKGALNTTGAQAEAFNQVLIEMGDVAGRTEAAFAVQTQSFTAQWKNFVNIAKEVGYILADILLPVLVKIMNAIKPYLAQFKVLNPEQQKWILIVIGMVAAAGPLLTILGTLITVLSALSWPIVAIVAALALLYLAWTNNWGGIQEKTAAVWAWLQPILQNIWNWLMVNIPIAIQALADFWTNVLVPAIQAAWNWINSIIEEGMQFITDLTSGKLGEWSKIWDRSTNLIKDNLAIMFTNLKLLFQAFQAAWNGDWRRMGELIRQIWDNMWRGIVERAKVHWANMKSWLSMSLTNLKNSFSNIDWASVGSMVIQKITDGLIYAIPRLLAGGVMAMQKLGQAMSEFIGGFFGGGGGVTTGGGTSSGGGGGGANRYARGTDGWETVPAGFPNDRYQINMSSGEQFAVIPRGGKLPGNSGTVNYYHPNITIYSGKNDPKKTMKGFI